MTDKEFEDYINNPPVLDKPNNFKGTGMPGKQSYDLVHSTNKDAYIPGELGSKLGKMAKGNNK